MPILFPPESSPFGALPRIATVATGIAEASGSPSKRAAALDLTGAVISQQSGRPKPSMHISMCVQ
jgi:hypothetical protein